MVKQCDGMSMASSGTGLTVFSDDRSSRMNSEVQGYTLCPVSAKWSKVDWAALHSTSGQWTKTYSKSNPGVFEGKKEEYSAMAMSISWFQPDWACISLAEDKTKGRKTHKQTTTEVSCSKGLAKHRSHCLQRILNKILNILFMIIFICPITFEPLKMGELCIKMVVIPNIFVIFVQPLELKLKICISILSWLFHFNSILVACRANIMKIVSVSKYIQT